MPDKKPFRTGGIVRREPYLVGDGQPEIILPFKPKTPEPVIDVKDHEPPRIQITHTEVNIRVAPEAVPFIDRLLGRKRAGTIAEALTTDEARRIGEGTPERRRFMTRTEQGEWKPDWGKVALCAFCWIGIPAITWGLIIWALS